MTTLLLGSTGMLGVAFRRLLPDAICPDRDSLDLDIVGEIEARVHALRPSRIINCAAYTDVDAAEGDEDAALRVNGEAVGRLAAAARHLEVPFVTFSSDYVFSGVGDECYTETSEPDPLNAYGRSKLAGELLALSYAESLVVRTSWLLSPTHPNFVTTILDLAAAGTAQVVDDQWGRPTMADDLAAATLGLAAEGFSGLVHLASPPTTTWFGLATEACVAAGIDPGRVHPCRTGDFPRPAIRPRWAVLGTDRGVAMPEWRPSLRRWLASA